MDLDGRGDVLFQGGPRRLAPMIAELLNLWERLGAPGRGRYGVSVNPAGRHRFWLDRPDNMVWEDAASAHPSSP